MATAACGEDATDVDLIPDVQGTWVVETQPTLLTNTCGLDLDPIILLGEGVKIYVRQQEQQITIGQIIARIEKDGSFKSFEDTSHETVGGIQIVMRLWFEGLFRGEQLDARMFLKLEFLEPGASAPTSCDAVYAFTARRISRQIVPAVVRIL